MATTTPLSILTPIPYPTKITTVFSDAIYDYYGLTPSPPKILEAAIFIAQHTNAEIKDTIRTLKDFLKLTREDCRSGIPNQSQKDLATTSLWFSIRTTTTRGTTIPRWHRDGRQFAADDKSRIHSKYSLTLLGNITRVLVENELTKAVVKSNDNFEVMRAKYAVRLAGEPYVEIGVGEVVRFTWGRVDSPVHSEPELDGDRVFVSVVWGSEGEVGEMCRWRGVEFMG